MECLQLFVVNTSLFSVVKEIRLSPATLRNGRGNKQSGFLMEDDF